MQIKEVADTFGVSPDTVRYYTRQGLLQPSKNPHNGYKEFHSDDLHRLRFIVNARSLGFSVEDVRSLLTQADEGHSPCAHARQIIEMRLGEVQLKIDELTHLRDTMRDAVRQWQDMPDKAPSKNLVCHLIAAFGKPLEK